jgi:tetratricopeptide (TPR) repeat protein
MRSLFLAHEIAVVLAIVFLCILSAVAQTPPGDSTELQVLAPATSFPEINRLVRAKKWQEVVTLTSELHRKDPENPVILYWLGTSHLQLNEAVPAVQAFRGAEKLGMNTAAFHEDLGLAYYDLNQFQLFEEQMKKAKAADPSDAKPDYYIGFYRWSIRSDPNGALEYFDKAIHLAPNDWKSVYQAGNCFEQLGKLEEAKARYQDAIRLLEASGAQFGWPYQGMARLMLDENLQTALVMAKKAVETQPRESSNHLILSDAYERSGNLQSAIEEAQIAASENPTDSKTHYSLYKLYRQAADARAKSELSLFEQTKKLYDGN